MKKEIRLLVFFSIFYCVVYYCLTKNKITMEMGFEPTRVEHNGLAVHRLNHSDTPSSLLTRC